MTRHKDRGDCKEVIGEFSDVFFASVWRTVNQGFRARLLKDELQELGSEATEPVPVHDYNLFDQTGEDAFQKGRKAFALEVEAAADV